MMEIRKKILATLKGTLNSSLEILMDELKDVGDTVSLNSLPKIIPSGADTTKFFYDVIRFCTNNGKTRTFRIVNILRGDNTSEVNVAPVYGIAYKGTPSYSPKGE